MILVLLAGCARIPDAPAESAAPLPDASVAVEEPSSESIPEYSAPELSEPESNSNSEPEASAPESSEPTSSAVESPVFHGEAVRSLYIFHYADRSYTELTPADTDFHEAIPLLEQVEPQEVKSDAPFGFLLFTENNRYSWILSGADHELFGDSPGDRLYTIFGGNKLNENRHAQWLVYMKPENISRFRFSGSREGKQDDSFLLETEDHQKIAAAAECLKGIVVQPEPSFIEGGINPTATFDSFSITIDFSTGVQYYIGGSIYGFGIMSSDRQSGVWYRCDMQEILRLREVMWQLHVA